MSTLKVLVVRKVTEGEGICALELAPIYGNVLPAFTAGSHIDVHVSRDIVRQYSLCNDPRESHRYVIGVLRDPNSRGGSSAMHEVKEGDILEISQPKNHFPLSEGPHASLLLAGGIGVTPILCMAERLAVLGSDFTMHYCARSPIRMAFFKRIRTAIFADRVHLHFDDGDEQQRLKIADLLLQAKPNTHLYVCGPKGFMDAVLNTARELSWSEAQLHYEFFSAEVVKSNSDSQFTVVLAGSGRSINVPADMTVALALAAAGVEIPMSCEQGICGTCLTRVIDGEPDHRDMYLSDQEKARNDQFTPCCSRAKSSVLVLDL